MSFDKDEITSFIMRWFCTEHESWVSSSRSTVQTGCERCVQCDGRCPTQVLNVCVPFFFNRSAQLLCANSAEIELKSSVSVENRPYTLNSGLFLFVVWSFVVMWGWECDISDDREDNMCRGPAGYVQVRSAVARRHLIWRTSITLLLNFSLVWNVLPQINAHF